MRRVDSEKEIIAAFEGAFVPVLALLCLLVSLALQVGVNYANDYSDGVRGTDAGAPGKRPDAPGNAYGAYLRDPCGNKICAFAQLPADA